jgi:hypothetical protein
MTFSNELINGLIAEAKYDQVSFDLLVSGACRELHVQDADEIRIATLALVERLLKSGEVVFGFYWPTGHGEIEISKDSIPEIVKRIDSEWQALGRQPSIGDIGLFVGKDDVIIDGFPCRR